MKADIYYRRSNMKKTDYFWFKECPICDGQGRLIIKKTLTLISYFSVAMSVWVVGKMKMSGWVTPTSLSKEINKLNGK